MDLIRSVEEKILSTVKEISKFFEGEVSYLTLEEQLKKTLDGLGLDLLQMILVTLEEENIKKSVLLNIQNYGKK